MNIEQEARGEKTDVSLRNGPVEDRTCTDFGCCICFVLMWMIFMVGFLFAFYNGDPSKAFSFYDSDSNERK